MCNYGGGNNITLPGAVKFVDRAIRKFPRAERILIGSNGSLLDEREIPKPIAATVDNQKRHIENTHDSKSDACTIFTINENGKTFVGRNYDWDPNTRNYFQNYDLKIGNSYRYSAKDYKILRSKNFLGAEYIVHTNHCLSPEYKKVDPALELNPQADTYRRYEEADYLIFNSPISVRSAS